MFSIVAALLLTGTPFVVGVEPVSADERLFGQVTAAEAVNLAESNSLEQIDQLLAAGDEQDTAEDFEASADSYQKALTLIENFEAPLPLRKGEALYGLGYAYAYQENYDSARPFLEAALKLYRALAADQMPADRTAPDYADIQIDLSLILGFIYQEKANFGTALTYYRPGLKIAQAAERTSAQAFFQHNIGAVEAEIGQYDLAKETLAAAAALSHQTNSIILEAGAVLTLGLVAERQQDYSMAIEHYRTALALLETAEAQTNDEDIHRRKIRLLNNLGIVHINQSDYAAAAQSFDRGFSLLAAQDSPAERAVLLNSVGSLNEAKGDAQKAWSVYLQALRLSQQAEDTVGETEVLLNLGQLMEAQERPEVAIFFYKQAIAKIETVRQDLQQLSSSMQQRYTLTIEDFYRNLADLLLQQNRESEALQILDLLKLQEVAAYLHTSQLQKIDNQLNNETERALLEIFEALPAENSLADFLSHPAATSLQSATDRIPFDTQIIESLKASLANQPVKTAVLYPLILEDRLEILLITPAGAIERFSTAVSKEALSQTINQLQKSLKSKAFDPEAPAAQLYDWLIRPLDETLAANRIENIIYLPDGALRYVPLAAFYDGQHWLAQKYQSHNITAAALDDLSAPSKPDLSVIAGAFTDSDVTHRVEVGTDAFEFEGLSAAKKEIENLSALMPDTLSLLDADFTHERLLAGVGDRNILHLATHAKFVPGQPEDSFILFGDGEAVNMRSLREWVLPNVDLVVLSACQTANSTEGEGKEILGLGFQVHQTGAKGAIASLWAVDDSATAALMTQFYQALSTGQTKAQALQSAQVELIKSNGFSHPYDWGAFVLIGNGQ